MGDDFDVDDILENLNQKKKIKSGTKGKAAEREICHFLNNRFAALISKHPDWGMFSRSIGSGNRWGQGVSLGKQALDTYSGDITCPPTFRFTIESKKGYNDIDLCAAFEDGCKGLDEFMKQVSDDADRTGRKPLILWKKDRKPRLAVLMAKDLPEVFGWDYGMDYGAWFIVSANLLFEQPDEYFFDLGK
jgi:hypothetical protein